MHHPNSEESLRMHQCVSTIRRVCMASVVLPTDCILLNRYDAGLVLPPTYVMEDCFCMSQVEVTFQRLTERK